ncbi:hypothetical protein C8R46DRAFT_44959 [Mycena filopes]|nr:hypothetical protein C8R46DRAFT_44959 [Mycena filopes]
MERDFGIALVLNISCFCSLVVTVYRWTTHRGLSLPLEEEPAQQSSIQAAVFDVAKVDDFSDGQPVDEVAFWTRIRPRKLALALVLATVVFIASVTEGKIEYYQVAFPVYTAYLAFLAALSVATTDRTAHAYYTTTLAVLSTSAFILLLVDFIIPSPSVSNPGRRCHLVIYLAISALALTMPRGPQLYYPPQNVYAKRILNSGHGSSVNVNGVVDASVWGSLFFSYISKVAMLPPGFGVADLPILTAAMRAPVTFSQIRSSLYRSSRLQLPAGMRFGLAVLRANAFHLIGVQLLSALTAVARCSPAYFMRLLLLQLEREAPVDIDSRWGLVYVAGLFAGNLVFALGWGQIWNLVHIAGIRIVSQTTTLLFVKTLVRKEAAAGGATAPKSKQGGAPIVHKAEILTLMSQDVHRVSDLSKHVYTLTDSPIQLVLSTWILYSLLGISCFVGLAATMICLPLQHFTGNMIFRTQSALMKAKDERITLTNEILGGIRMIKFMAWERKFEDRILEIRDKELLRQKITYVAKTLLTIVG